MNELSEQSTSLFTSQQWQTIYETAKKLADTGEHVGWTTINGHRVSDWRAISAVLEETCS